MRAVAGGASTFRAGRAGTSVTGEHYITGKLWEQATISSCPWHPDGDCGFCRHGTYSRVTPAGCRVARWYCPGNGRTVSALPDCLAAHRSGTLAELEACLLGVEQAESLSAAAATQRIDIELPGALRYLSRLRRDVHRALAIVRGLYPKRFAGMAPTLSAFAQLLGVPCVLCSLRADCELNHLPLLPAPLGFDPRRDRRDRPAAAGQHRAGRDPPPRLIEAHTPCPH